jgi:hypothetical protein
MFWKIENELNEEVCKIHHGKWLTMKLQKILKIFWRRWGVGWGWVGGRAGQSIELS